MSDQDPAAGAEQVERWRERGGVLAEQINRLIDSGAGAEAHAAERELFELLRAHSSVRDAANTAYLVARHHHAAGDFAGAITAFRDARSAYLEIADANGLSESDRGIALMHASTRQWDRAVAALHESARELMYLGATEKAAHAHISAAAFRAGGRRFIDAEPELDTADRLLSTVAASGAEHETLLFVAAITRARLAVVSHRTQDAEAALTRAQTAAAQDPLLTAFVDDQRAQLALRREDVPSYLHLLEQAAAKFQQHGAEPRLAAVELARLGLALEQRGDHDRAERTLRQTANLHFNSPPATADKSAAARVTPYLVVADLELDESTLARLARLRS